jgi:HNH endonuclease
MSSPIPVGYCECGCGQRTTLLRTGPRVGLPRRFMPGHQLRTPLHQGAQYREEDRGYPTPCWVWLRASSNKGYGVYGHDARPAHVVYYEHVRGPVPTGMELDHLCRVRACVNPEHLEPVSRAENARRSPLVAKLTSEDVRAIRGSQEPQRVTAARYGVARQTVSDIRLRRRWRDLP